MVKIARRRSRATSYNKAPQSLFTSRRMEYLKRTWRPQWMAISQGFLPTQLSQNSKISNVRCNHPHKQNKLTSTKFLLSWQKLEKQAWTLLKIRHKFSLQDAYSLPQISSKRAHRWHISSRNSDNYQKLIQRLTSSHHYQARESRAP